MRYNPSEKGESQNSRPESRGKMTSNRPSRPEKKPFVPAKPSVPNLNEPLRINKALAFAGICSRRAADDLIAQGVVFVNGKKVEEPGVKIIPVSDVLEVNAERVMFDTEKAEPLYVLLHKPVQTVCTANDPEGRPTVLDILPQEFKEKRIFPVGRLDFFSTGLLLLTNDGELTHRLTHPKWHQNKVYRVRVRGDVSEQVLDTFRKGMTLEEGEKLAPVECKILAHDEGNTRVEMVLTQGINRQIRRMFRDVGMTILNLHRVKLGPIELGELAKGESRELTQEELAMLYKATGLNK
jgi:pseudouridine synthase